MDEDAVLAMNGAQLCQMAIEKNIPVRLGKVLKQVSGCLPGRTMDDLDNIPNEYNRLKHKKWMVPLDNRHLYEDRLLRVLRKLCPIGAFKTTMQALSVSGTKWAVQLLIFVPKMMPCDGNLADTNVAEVVVTMMVRKTMMGVDDDDDSDDDARPFKRPRTTQAGGEDTPYGYA